MGCEQHPAYSIETASAVSSRALNFAIHSAPSFFDQCFRAHAPEACSGFQEQAMALVREGMDVQQATSQLINVALQTFQWVVFSLMARVAALFSLDHSLEVPASPSLSGSQRT